MVLASRDGTPTRYYAQAGGRPALLVLADEACVARLDALAEGLTAIGDADLTVHVVGPPALAGHDLPFPLPRTPTVACRGRLPHRGAHRPRSCSTPTCGSVRRCRWPTVPASPPTSPSWSPSWSGTTGGRDRSPPRRPAGGAGRARPRAVRRAHRRGSSRATARPGWSRGGWWARRATQRPAEASPRPHRAGSAARPRAGRHNRSSGPARAVQGVRVGRAASRASRLPATRRPTVGSSALTATTSAPRPRTVGSRSPSTSTTAIRAVSCASPSTGPSCTGRLPVLRWCSAARTCTRSSR